MFFEARWNAVFLRLMLIELLLIGGAFGHYLGSLDANDVGAKTADACSAPLAPGKDSAPPMGALPNWWDGAPPMVCPSSRSGDAARSYRAMRARENFIPIIRAEAERNALPADVADAVAYVESGYHADSIGGVGEIGLMQVRPGTAAMLGFRGSDRELAVPETNIRYGVTYLAQAWRLADGDLCRALMKYRAGHGEERMTLRSVEYCSRAKVYLRRIDSALLLGTGSAREAQPALAATSVYAMRGASNASGEAPRLRAAKHSAPQPRAVMKGGAFWAAHEARIRSLKLQLYAKWRGKARFGSASHSAEDAAL